jgi:hypothetical protein
LEIRQRAAGFPHFHSAGGGDIYEEGGKTDGKKIQFQLTESGHFKQDKNASVAALRKRPALPRNQ